MKTRNGIASSAGIVILLVVCIGITVSRRHQATLEKEQCLVYLRCIESGKVAWASIYHHSAKDTPTWDDLRPYFENIIWGSAGASNGEKLPHCPAGGTYTIGRVADTAQCSIPGHALPPWPDAVIAVEDVAGSRLPDAKVEIKDAHGNIFESSTDAHGIAKYHKWPIFAVGIRVSKTGYIAKVDVLPAAQPPAGPILLEPQEDKASTNQEK
jgi:hypothetical protein